MSNSEVIIKYVKPSKLDKEPQATICKVMNNQHDSELYIQISDDIDHPTWEKLGIFLEKSLIDLVGNRDFIDQCMRLHEYNADRPLDRICDIIKEHKG